MTRKNIIIGNNIYKTQKECEIDVRNRLIEIGIAKSVRNNSIENYNFFIDLCKRHPHQNEKLRKWKLFSLYLPLSSTIK